MASIPAPARRRPGIIFSAAATASGRWFTWPGSRPASWRRRKTGALDFGIGLTTAVERPTSRASQVHAQEFEDAASALAAKIAFYRPRCVAFLGKAAYAGIMQKRTVEWGEQAERFGGARVWILPNPSGLNRGFSMERLVAAYSVCHRALLSARMPPPHSA